MSKIAALYVETDGTYYGLNGVVPYDIKRDARKYDGPYSVVAHPPCNLWVNFAALNYKRYGGEHNRPGNDGGCFQHALQSVMRFGGVLEHPAFSHAWKTFALPRPTKGQWSNHDGLWVCEVWQSAYGHKARKRTWLLYCGDNPPADMRWDREPGTHQCGWFDRIKPTLSKTEAKATPAAFRDALIELARNARD